MGAHPRSEFLHLQLQSHNAVNSIPGCINDFSMFADMVSTVGDLLLGIGPIADGVVDATGVADLLEGGLSMKPNTEYIHLEHYKVMSGNTSLFKAFLIGYSSISADDCIDFTPMEVVFLSSLFVRAKLNFIVDAKAPIIDADSTTINGAGVDSNLTRISRFITRPPALGNYLSTCRN